MATPSKSPPHVVIFPFMAQGHTIPVLDISKAMAHHGAKVTIITTPSNAPFILSKTSHHPQISLSIIQFPKVEELPEGCENVSDLPSMHLLIPFIIATKKLKQPFEDILKKMSQADSLPICVISDMFLGWTVETCRSFGIPRISFHGMGVLPMAIVKSVLLHAPWIKNLSDLASLELPNLTIPFSLIKADLTQGVGVPEHPFFPIGLEIQEADKNSCGVIVNSFEELEGDYVAALASFFQKGAKAWCVGPALLCNQIDQELHNGSHMETQSFSYIKWLNQQVGSGVVIYVSFGSQSEMPDMQMDEIAFGLEMAGQPFILVVRSKTWVPPDGWTERIKDKGFVARDWVDQRGILSHPATGGFLTHCGWNSVLEGLSMRVPLLAWPMGSEQILNAKYVVMKLGVGLMVPQESVGGEKMVTIDRHVICDGVKDLMRGEEGRKARERAQLLGKIARKAVEKGGSSYKILDEFIETFTRNSKNHK